MQTDEIRTRIKRIIATVTGIPVEEISDDVSFRDDLDLDSLSLLEVGVDVDYEFKLNLKDLDEQLRGLSTLADVVSLVERLLRDRPARTGAA